MINLGGVSVTNAVDPANPIVLAAAGSSHSFDLIPGENQWVFYENLEGGNIDTLFDDVDFKGYFDDPLLENGLQYFPASEGDYREKNVQFTLVRVEQEKIIPFDLECTENGFAVFYHNNKKIDDLSGTGRKQGYVTLHEGWNSVAIVCKGVVKANATRLQLHNYRLSELVDEMRPSVVYGSGKDHNPPVLEGLPNQTTNEDIALPPKFINLWNYATDDNPDSQLFFTIISQSNPDLISCYLDRDTWTKTDDEGNMVTHYGPNKYVSCDPPTANQSGESEITIMVIDFDGLSDMNSFLITVNPINDKPVINNSFGNQFAAVGRTFMQYLPITDVDEGDTLTFSDDTELFDIDVNTGLIKFKPTDENIGEYLVTFTVTDTAGESDTKTVKFTVENVMGKWALYGAHSKKGLNVWTNLLDTFNGGHYRHNAGRSFLGHGLSGTVFSGYFTDPVPQNKRMAFPLIHQSKKYDRAAYYTNVYVQDAKNIRVQCYCADALEVYVNDEEVLEFRDYSYSPNFQVQKGKLRLDDGWNSLLFVCTDIDRKGGEQLVIIDEKNISSQVDIMSAELVDTNPIMASLPAPTIEEDSGPLEKFIYLTELASDSETAQEDLVFSIAEQTNPDLINCSIDENSYVNCAAPAANQNGVNEVTVQVMDLEELVATQLLTITVTPMADQPVLEAIEDQTVNVGELFTLSVIATDNDIGFQPEQLIFTADTDLFEIHPTSGIISFTPRAADEGEHDINIIVTDVYDLSDIKSFKLTVNIIGTNHPPVLDPIGARTGTVGVEFYYDVNASDADSDPLTFSDDTSLFNIDVNTGEIRFMPQATDVGYHDVNISVTDDQAVDWELVSFSINTPDNNAPVLDFIPDQTVNVGQAFLYDVNATDEDNDPLTFSDNTGMFDINLNTGLISFIPQAADAGEHDVIITVDDGRGGSDNQTVHFSILANNPPELDFIDYQYLIAGTLYSYTVTASDADSDPLTFSDNTSLFDINADTGEISFMPLQVDAGVHPVKITVTDSKGAENYQDAILYIIDGTGNQAPYLIPLGPQTADVDVLFTLDVNANTIDPDASDVLTFSDNTGLFDINATSGLISFTPQEAELGDHDVTITVSDGTDTDFEVVTFTIQGAGNQAPSAPALRSPNASYTYNQTVRFRWFASNDPDNDDLTYHIQVGNSDFSTIYHEAEGLSNLSRTFTLDLGMHYWKVRTFDGELYSDFSNRRRINVLKQTGGGGGSGGGGFSFSGGADEEEPEEPEEEPSPTYTAIQANAALDEARDAMDELQEKLDDLTKVGIELDDEVLDLLDEAEAELADAEIAFLDNDFDAVIEHAGLALDLIEEAMGLLPELVAEFTSGVGFVRTAKTIALTVDGATVNRTFISLYVENNTNQVQTSIGVFETIPKDIVEFAAEINSTTEFRVIEPDPQLLFLIPNLGPKEVHEIVYSFEGTVTQKQLDSMVEPIIAVSLMETAICNHVVCDDGNPDTVDYCQHGVCVHELPETGADMTAPLFPVGFLALTPEQLMPVMLGVIIVLLLAIGFFEREKIGEEWKKLQNHFHDKPAAKANQEKKKGK